MKVLALTAFTDNYIWMLTEADKAWAIDPGDADPVLRILEQENLHLAGILVTHGHNDHIRGIASLVKHHPVEVYGPRLAPPAAHISKFLDGGDDVRIGPWRFTVLTVPGHTLDHIAFYCEAEKVLFCGDVIFSAGCGRIREGTYAQTYQSLQKLAALPDDTLVYCAHEYTLDNLAFAEEVEPHNRDIQHHIRHCKLLRAQNLPTLPTALAQERKINPFLRCRNAAEFIALREWKNRY